ncbi:MAG: hypothetical protein LJE70_10130, partial [Chromatiaceae bacterium]|nr:hypothetical protein [Chromatiaceae bacterium]
AGFIESQKHREAEGRTGGKVNWIIGGIGWRKTTFLSRLCCRREGVRFAMQTNGRRLGKGLID